MLTASMPLQFIHSTLITVPTKLDGEIIILISVDNFSKYCFKPALIKELTAEVIQNHINDLLKEHFSNNSEMKPTIYISYGKKYIEWLQHQSGNLYNIEFNPVFADEVALPIAKSFRNYTGK